MSHKENVRQYLTERKSKGATVQGIADHVGAPSDSVRRILNELKAEGCATSISGSGAWECVCKQEQAQTPQPLQPGDLIEVPLDYVINPDPTSPVEVDDEPVHLVDRDGDPVSDEATILLDEMAEVSEEMWKDLGRPDDADFETEAATEDYLNEIPDVGDEDTVNE